MTGSLADRRILVGVCGSIAAYKAAELVRQLRKEGADVTVAMTAAATEFVGAATFAAFSTHPVVLEQFPDDPATGVPHVEIAEKFEAVVIAPATANILGKAAHAVADDFLSTLLNIVECPVLFVPAMNYRMWRNPATREAVGKLRERGRQVLDPDEGALATLHVGVGRFPETGRIVSGIRELLELPQPLRGKGVLVTAGPTREPLDPVRYLSNRSSGRMGYALATAARDLGAEVTLISGPVGLAAVAGCRLVAIETAEELLAAVEQELPGLDALIMAAAVADFQPETAATEKLSRSGQPGVLALKPTPDIIKAVRGKFKGALVAFSLQGGDDLGAARQKLKDKGADLLVVNRYDEEGAGYDVATNHVWILSAKDEEVELGPAPKEAIAREILQHVIPYIV